MKHLTAALVVALLASCAPVPFEVGGYAPPVDEIPRFIDHDMVNLDVIEQISTFRSGAGHNYPDAFENNRSMKHYYKPFEADGGTNDTIAVFAPFDGTMVMNWVEGTRSNQIRIVSADYPYPSVVIFHVAPTISLGDTVAAGDQIGWADVTSDNPDNPTSDFDVAVWLADGHAVSFISLMTDSLFASYQARGATSRDDFVLTKSWRDANPVDTWNNDFANDWVVLDPP